MKLNQVVARIEGGLGNQLFQYAAARSLADRLGCELALDLRGLEVNGDRPFQLDHYCTRASIADSILLDQLPSPRASRKGRLLSRLSPLLPAYCRYPAFWPRSFAFDSRLERLSYPVYLIGYWQSERYFSWNRDRILQDISLRQPDPQAPFLQKILGVPSAALHIRRGDYVSNAAASQFHGLCDMRYYQRAVLELKSHVPDIEIFVFSDDHQWVRENLQLDAPVHYVDIYGADQGHLDLELMRRCRHHIIANSSFSWWGAWLCQQPQQMVYAPARWFADSGVDTSDVIPAAWVRMD